MHAWFLIRLGKGVVAGGTGYVFIAKTPYTFFHEGVFHYVNAINDS